MTDNKTAEAKSVWTEGVYGDGAAIMCDGVLVAVGDVIAALNDRERLKTELAAAHRMQTAMIKVVKALQNG